MTTEPSDIQRRVRQQGADITSLYELMTAVDQKIDRVDAKVDGLAAETRQGFAQIGEQLAAILRRLDG